MKQTIISYYNTLDNGNDYIIMDFFHNTSPKCGRLTYLGYRRLRDLYKMYSLDIDLPETVKVYSHMSQKVNGFWYYSKAAGILYTTDKASITKLTLHGSSFDIVNKLK